MRWDKVSGLMSSMQSIFLIVLGFVFVLNRDIIWFFAYASLMVFFLILSISQGFRKFKRKKDAQGNLFIAFSAIGLVLFGILFPQIFIAFVPYVIGWWALLNGVAQSINFYVCRRDGLSHAGHRFVLALVGYVFAFMLIMNPVRHFDALSAIAGMYLIVLGFTDGVDALTQLLSDENKNKVRKRFSLSVPVFVSTLIPQRVFFSVSNLVKDKSFKQDGEPCDLEVFIHLAAKGVEAIGHVEFSYKGKIYSYGCHDAKRRTLMGTLGDGVLIVSDEEKLLRHNVADRKKIIVGYGIALSEEQHLIIEERIESLLSRTYPFTCLAQSNEMEAKGDYLSKVYEDTGAHLYKFKKGEFRTYFAVSTNCVLLVDYVLRNPQLDLFTLTGIITPGNYLSFLNEEYRKGRGIVRSRKIITKEMYETD